ncbi:hypothetical protein [Dokdonella sp.]|uniref:hypothetical protein n=1 Tax=Dokdonella sp. TaxID=2291710 RepID=UPI001B0E85FB|nr:hypothetical protein [Dokdonella sp.]MBO9664158.1 hypothetical protein [Dokdonella sp.]
MIDELGSVSGLWKEALSRIEFEPPDEEFTSRLVSKLDGSSPRSTGIDTSTSFALRGALQMLCARQANGMERQLIQALIDNRDRLLGLAFDPKGNITLLPMEAALNVAAAQTALQAAAPDRPVLRRLVRFFIDRCPSNKKTLHSSFYARMLTSAYAAWLLQDLDLLRELTSLRKSVADYPLQWPFLRHVAQTARAETVDEVSYIRCDDPGARADFLRFFRSNRMPYETQRPVELGREGVLFGPVVGAYYFSWLYLQTFAPSPIRQTDWDLLRELIMG